MKKIFLVIVLLFVSVSSLSFAKDEYLRAKLVSLEDTRQVDNPQEAEQIARIEVYKVKILEGEDKGKEISVDFPVYKLDSYNIHPKVNDKIILYKTQDEENQTKFYISDVDKRGGLLLLSLIFFFMVILVSKYKGFKAIVALVSSVFFIAFIFIPAISNGGSPILFAVLSCVFASLVSIYLIAGFTKKALVSVLGTITGVAISGIISHIFIHQMRLTGYTSTELLTYGDILKDIDLRELISAGIIIGSLGAIMDVTVSIASSINEIYEHNKNIKILPLYRSAIKIGNDIIGTMINTLILAYIGSSLLSVVLIYMQRRNYKLSRILNFEEITVEILRSLCGSIGIIVAVPITAFIGAYFYTQLRKKSKK